METRDRSDVLQRKVTTVDGDRAGERGGRFL